MNDRITAGHTVPAIVVAGLIIAGLATAAEQPGMIEIPTVNLEQAEPGVREALTHAREQLEQLDSADTDGETLARHYAELGGLYMAHDFAEPARAAFHNAISLIPGDAQWQYLLAYTEAFLGNTHTAIEHYSHSIELQPEYVPSYVRRGRLHLDENQLDRAGKDFRRALELDPDSTAARAGLGRVAMERGDYAQAVELLETALKEEPQADRLHHHLGMAYRNLDRADEARRELEQSGDRAPSLADPVLMQLQAVSRSSALRYQQALSALESGDLVRAEQLLERSVELNPEEPSYAFTHGQVLARLGRFALARGAFEHVLDLEPESTEAWLMLGRVEQADDEPARAIDAFRQVLDLEPGHDRARESLADLWLVEGDFSRAANTYGELAESAGNTEDRLYFGFWNGLAQIAGGDCSSGAETLETLNASVEEPLGPALLAIARARSTCLDTSEEQLEEALEWADRFYSAQPNLETAETLAMVAAATGHHEDAVDLQMQAIFEALRAGLDPESIPDLQGNLRRYEAGEKAVRPYDPRHPVIMRQHDPERQAEALIEQ